MQDRLRLLLFLSAPFLCAGLPSGIRLAGLILLAAAYTVAGVRHPAPAAPEETTSPLWFFLLVGVPLVALAFLMSDPWQNRTLFPPMASGFFLLPLAAGTALSGLEALACLAGGFWFLLFLIHGNPDWLPLHAFHDFLVQWTPSSPPADLSMGDSIIGIIPPPHPIDALLIVMALLSTTVLGITIWTMLEPYRLIQRITAILLLPWSAVVIQILGPAGYTLLGLVLLLFFLLYRLPRGSLTFATLWPWLALLLFFILGSKDGLGPLNILLARAFSSLSPWEPPALQVPLFSLTSFLTLPAVWESGRSQEILSMLLFLFLLIPFAARSSLVRRADPRFTAAIALVFVPLLFLRFSPTEWLALPTLWLFTGMLLTTPLPKPPMTLRLPWNLPELSMKQAAGALHVVVFFFAAVLLFFSWRCESLQRRCLQENDPLRRAALVRDEGPRVLYRGDWAALSVTLALDLARANSSAPDEKQLVDWDVVLLRSLRYGYLPALALHRLDEFFWKSGNTEASLHLLADALRVFPDQAPLREELADRYMELKRYRDALDEYQRCVDARPTVSRLRQKLAAACQALGLDEDAERAARSARLLDPLVQVP